MESWEPMFPYPTIPSFFPRISWNPSADFAQTPRWRFVLRSNTPRRSRIISPRASSTTLRVLL